MEKRDTESIRVPETVVQSYLEAVRRKDLSVCVGFYSEDSEIHFMNGVFKGKDAIEQWHNDRFAAELEFLEIGKLRVDGSRVTFDAVISTKRLKSWKISKLAGKASLLVEQGKIRRVKLSPRVCNPLEGW